MARAKGKAVIPATHAPHTPTHISISRRKTYGYADVQERRFSLRTDDEAAIGTFGVTLPKGWLKRSPLSGYIAGA